MPQDREAKNIDMVEFERLLAASVTRDPFPFVIVPGFVKSAARSAVEADYPKIARSGSFPLSAVECGPAILNLVETLTGARMRAIIAEKFGIALEGRPVMVTMRGQCTARDGHVHTDSSTKLITMLLYINRTWECASARLRLLRSANDLEDYAAEVPPEESTLVIFRNGPRAWHGFSPFHGERRVMQINWVTDRSVVRREEGRHRVSAFFKRALFGRARGGVRHASAR